MAESSHRIAAYVVLHCGDEDEWPVAAFDDVYDAERWAEEMIGVREYGSGTREDPRGYRWRIVFLQPDRDPISL